MRWWFGVGKGNGGGGGGGGEVGEGGEGGLLVMVEGLSSCEFCRRSSPTGGTSGGAADGSAGGSAKVSVLSVSVAEVEAVSCREGIFAESRVSKTAEG